MDLEGIVSKRIGSRYVSGRTRAWLKTKNPNFSGADLGAEKPKNARKKGGRSEQSDDGVSVVFLSGRINSRWDWSPHGRYSLDPIELNCTPLTVKWRYIGSDWDLSGGPVFGVPKFERIISPKVTTYLSL